MSLRDKKRELLRSTIEKTAVALVHEHGYENVTVEMICEASLASQRTFFNYFGSKEAVILGPAPQAPDEEVLDEFVHHPHGDVLSDLTRMMLRVLDARGDVDLTLWRDRREVIRRDPELMRAQAERFAAKDTELVAVVQRRLEAQHAERGRSDGEVPADDLAEQARLIVSLWWGTVRYAMHRWAERPTDSSQQITDDLLHLLARIKESLTR